MIDIIMISIMIIDNNGNNDWYNNDDNDNSDWYNDDNNVNDK